MVYVKKGFEFEDTYDIYSRIPNPIDYQLN